VAKIKKAAFWVALAFILSFLFQFRIIPLKNEPSWGAVAGLGRNLATGSVVGADVVGLSLGGGSLQHDAAQGQVEFPQGGHPALGRQLAFPDDDDMPSGGLQEGLVAGIALAVAGNLVVPELGIGHGLVPLAVMAVPEASVHQDDGPPFLHDYVGSAWQLLDIEAITEPLVPQPAAHHHLGLGVASADAAHAAVPLLRCHLVGHAGAKLPHFDNQARAGPYFFDLKNGAVVGPFGEKAVSLHSQITRKA